jgi:hypothetical protein
MNQLEMEFPGCIKSPFRTKQNRDLFGQNRDLFTLSFISICNIIFTYITQYCIDDPLMDFFFVFKKFGMDAMSDPRVNRDSTTKMDSEISAVWWTCTSIDAQGCGWWILSPSDAGLAQWLYSLSSRLPYFPRLCVRDGRCVTLLSCWWTLFTLFNPSLQTMFKLIPSLISSPMWLIFYIHIFTKIHAISS